MKRYSFRDEGSTLLFANYPPSQPAGLFLVFMENKNPNTKRSNLCKACYNFYSGINAGACLSWDNFLWNAVERYLTDEIYYLGSDGGNDSASVVADENTGFLILTNGID
jgi:hypothetical protein